MTPTLELERRRSLRISRPAGAGELLAAGWLPSLVGIALLVILEPLDHVWLVAIILCALVLTLPGVLLLRALRISTATVLRFPLYVPAAAVFVVSMSGMFADLVFPHLGVAKPLHGDTTELTTVAVCLILWVVGLTRQQDARLDWFGALTSLGLLTPLVLPLLAAAGALLLTNGNGNAVAAITAVALPLTLLYCLLRANRLSRGQVAMLLFACALAAEWAYSLLSQEIIGFDISTEVGLAQTVHSAGIWHLNETGNAYGAMLSLTVLPATLAQMVGISPLIAFKVLYPIFTAMLPVAIFFVGERFMARRWAAAAASLLLVQYYFFQQLAEIGRQEVGLLFFAGLVALLFDQDTHVTARLRLAVVLGLGLVVSHYSSTYFAIIFFFLALVAYALVFRWRPRRTRLSPLLAVALVVVGGGAALYYGPITHSASNLSSFTKVLSQDGFDLFPSSSGNILKSYLNENTGYSVTAEKYEKLAVKDYAGRKYIRPLKQASEAKYQLKSASVPGPTTRISGLASLLSTFGTAFGELMLVLVGIGSLVALFTKEKRLRVVGVFGLSMIVVLLVFRFSATLAASYNQTRALLQALLILAIPAGLLAQRVAGRFNKIVTVFVAGALALMFAIQDGATWLIVQGGQPMNLAKSGEAFERFYETPAELAGAKWVTQASKRSLVYADEYGVLRFQAAGTQFDPLQAVTPETIDERAWVYGTRTNDTLGRARGDLNSNSVIYRFPKQFLNAYYDTVFNDGDTSIWHR